MDAPPAPRSERGLGELDDVADRPELRQRFDMLLHELRVVLPGVQILLAFLLMTAAAAGLTVWAVRRLMAPLRVLAAAADALGRDVNAPALPESGPTEVSGPVHRRWRILAGIVSCKITDSI